MQTIPGCEDISAVTLTTKTHNLHNHNFAAMEQTNASRDQFEHAQAAHRHVDGTCCSHCEHDCAARRDANRTRDWAYFHAIIATPRAAIGHPVNNTVDAAIGNINEVARQRSASWTLQAPPPATTHQPRENTVRRDQHPDQLAPIDVGRQEQAAAGTPLPGIASVLEGPGIPAAQVLVRPADMQVERRTLAPEVRPTPDHWVPRHELSCGHREARMASLELELDLHALNMQIVDYQMRARRSLYRF
jgi:hypothetical protein